MNTRERASRVKEEARAERLAALNLIEDALLARRELERANVALRESEAKLALELAATQQLQRISSSLVEEDRIEALYGQILDAARSLMHADFASLQKLVPERNELLLVHHLGFAPASAEHWKWVSAAETTSCGLAMSRRERIVVRDAEQWGLLAGTDDLEHYRLCGIRAMQSTPLVSRSGRLVGMISTHWREPHEPSERELGFFDVLARQVADLLERRAAEEALRVTAAALRASEERLRAMAENLPGGATFVVDHALRYQVAGGEALTSSGLKPEDFIGRTVSEVVGKELAALHEPNYRKALAGEAFAIEHESHGRHFLSRGVPLRDSEGRVTAALAVSYDISDRKRAEEALRESEQRLRTLSDAVPQIIWTNTADGLADYFNRRWYEYSGLPFEESARLGWEAIVHRDDAPRSKPAWREALATGEIFETEYRLRRADGEYRWFIGRNVPMRDAAGRVTGWFGTATDIQDLKETEAALQASEEQFRRAVEDAPIPVVMHAEDGQVLQISKTWTALTGYQPEEMPSFEAWLNRANTRGADEVLGQMRRLCQGEVSVLNTEFGVTTRTGERRCWAFSASAPGTLRDGRRFIVGMALDITDRQEMEGALRESQERLLLAQEAGQVGIWDWDLTTGESNWSETLWSLFGYREFSAISPRAAWRKHVAAEDRRRIQQSLAALVASEARDFRSEFRLERADGETRWLESVARVRRDGAGRAVSMSGVNFDVTERKRSEAALMASEERLRLVVENAREYAIFSLDLARTILGWNSGAEAILGYSREEAIGQSGDIIFTAEDCQAGAPESEAENAFQEDRATDERWHVRKDGSVFWGSGVMMAMRDAEGTVIGFVKIFRDETAARAAREALEQSQRELWEAVQENELARAEAERARAQAVAAGEAKDHFLAVLSHELRTPLTPVAMAAQSLARRKDLPQPVREALEMIRRNVLIESRLVDDLLDVTKIERGKMELVLEPVRMHEAIRNAVETTRGDLEAKGQRLSLELGGSNDLLQGDGGRLQQVLWNLLKNASKFTPQGGEIRVQTRNEHDRLVVEVSDTGIGIDPEALPRIFTAFTQASVSITRQFGGLGLGLAIARAIVLAHGGELWVASEGLGCGATFSFSLPVAPVAL